MIKLLIYFVILSHSSFALEIDPDAINVPQSYTIEPYVINLSVPTTALFDGNDLLIAESGFLDVAAPRVLRIYPNKTYEIVVDSGLEAPVTGLSVINETLYISHKGKISIFQNGSLMDIITGLPSNGDHHNNKITLGPDGKIYMGQGTTTNAAVVGEDNFFQSGWLLEYPYEHERPCKDIILRGINFETNNPLTEQKDDRAITGAYKPFGVPSRDGEIINGSINCGGSIVRFNPDGSDFELVAWGLRNPYGLQFDGHGNLWTTNHGSDVRGSRNIFNDPDYLIKVKEGAWYGWPEFFNGKAANARDLKAPTKEQPALLWKEHPPLEMPYIAFDSHSGTNGLAFLGQDAYIAMFGTFSAPTSGSNLALPGFKVIKVNVENKTVEDFVYNELPGPSYLNRAGGLNRPSDVVFDQGGNMYIVDWGALAVDEEGLKFMPGSGIVWRLYRNESLGNPIILSSQENSLEEQKPLVKNSATSYKQIVPEIGIGLLPFVLVLLVIILCIIVIYVRRKEKKS